MPSSILRFSVLWVSCLLTACIGDDIIFDAVPEAVKITAWVDTLGVGDEFNFEARYTDEVGREVSETVFWRSSDDAILQIDGQGIARGMTKGNVHVFAEVMLSGEMTLLDSIPVVVDEETSQPPLTERPGTIKTTSSYVLEGSFVMKMDGNTLRIEIADDYKTTSALPGLYLYLTNNPSTNSGALEVGEVTVFEGEHVYEVSNAGLNDYDYLLYYCKPFSVKVGEGEIE